MGAITMPLFGQAVADAVRFGSSNITGTARYRSMAGAFGALGGDPSAMTDNPAGIGIYRGNSEISFTPNLSFSHAKVEGSATTENKKPDISVSNASWIYSIKTDGDHLVNFNIGLGFNHQEGFRRKYQMILNDPDYSFGDYLTNRANNALVANRSYFDPNYFSSDEAWDNGSIPLNVLYGWDTYVFDAAKDEKGNLTGGVANPFRGLSCAQQMYVTESNRTDEYNLCVSGNWDDFIYGGFTVSINDLNSTIQTEIDEDYGISNLNYTDYNQQFNNVESKGNGIGLKAGILIKPTDTWRIGFAAHTPTWYKMEDIYNATIETNANDDKGNPVKPSGGSSYSFKYRYNSPWQMQLSTAWVIAGRALVSAEADFQDFSTQKFKVHDDNWDDGAFDGYKDLFKNYCALQQTYKVGGEFRMTDNLSIRLGYAFKTSPYKSELYDNPAAFRSWTDKGNRTYGDDNTVLFDSSTKSNHSVLGQQEYYTAGLGWSNEWFHIDLSFLNRIMQEKVAAFPTTSALNFEGDDNPLFMEDNYDLGAVRATYCDMKTRILTWDITIGLRF